jgi:hypothetical protein
MSLLSHSPLESARKAYSRVLQALQEPGSQVALAKAMGTSESTISRLKNESLENALALIYQCGFKLVSADRVCVDPGALDFMRRTTVRAMAQEDMARQLFEEDE